MNDTNIIDSIKHSVEAVRTFFATGPIAQKIQDAEQILDSGHAVYFDGEVEWNLFLEEFDRMLSGRSENMEACVNDIRANLMSLADDYGAQTDVILTLQEVAA
jgi:hypothetical protein|tara:strand:+ start:29610 stop:29918 length:309 start_codon:yes stop_codon:yes gene_type:complete